MAERNYQSLGDRIVEIARLAAIEHQQMFTAVESANSMTARRQVASTDGVGRQRITDDPMHQQPSIGARVTDFRPRAPRAV